MKYKWHSIGDQDICVRKVCMLGPHMLEHIEDHWEEGGLDKHGNQISIMMMASNVYIWDSDSKEYQEINTKIPFVEYRHESKSNPSMSVLEDWYALNVLSEELLLGREDAKPKNKKVRRK